jgi:hypothetical protein
MVKGFFTISKLSELFTILITNINILMLNTFYYYYYGGYFFYYYFHNLYYDY